MIGLGFWKRTFWLARARELVTCLAMTIYGSCDGIFSLRFHPKVDSKRCIQERKRVGYVKTECSKTVLFVGNDIAESYRLVKIHRTCDQIPIILGINEKKMPGENGAPPSMEDTDRTRKSGTTFADDRG